MRVVGGPNHGALVAVARRAGGAHVLDRGAALFPDGLGDYKYDARARTLTHNAHIGRAA